MSEKIKVYSIDESASIGDSGPLGLAAFALTTFCLSVVNAGLIDKTAEGMVLMLAFAYGGIVQILAGMWEFKKNNTFGATAFCSYGAFWLSFTFFILGLNHGLINIPNAGSAVSLFLLAWTLFTFYMWIGSFAINKALFAVFTLLFLTFVFLDIGSFGNPKFGILSGYLGIATAIAAWYTSAAGVLNSVYKKAILPVGTKRYQHL